MEESTRWSSVGERGRLPAPYCTDHLTEFTHACVCNTRSGREVGGVRVTAMRVSVHILIYWSPWPLWTRPLGDPGGKPAHVGLWVAEQGCG